MPLVVYLRYITNTKGTYLDQEKYERSLLVGWEDVYKKGQLTLWILLALKDGAKHMAEIKHFIDESTEGSLQVDDKSMYRALRRYSQAELVDFTTVPSQSGPDRKVYTLTKTGAHVLETFVTRNVHIFYKPAIATLIKGK